MRSIFSHDGLQILQSLAYTQTLYAFDFDGTLSKIVSDPDGASLAPTTRKLLQELNAVARIAIVSGRSVSDLRKRIEINPYALIGNHGLEDLSSSDAAMRKARPICEKWKMDLSQADLPAGVVIEDKVFSLAIHYRNVRNKRTARKRILALISSHASSARLVPGKLVYNLLPKGARHKGTAVLDRMTRGGFSRALYIGDDDTDEDVFSMPTEDILSIRVGRKMASNARFFLPKQSDIQRLLALLVKNQKDALLIGGSA